MNQAERLEIAETTAALEVLAKLALEDDPHVLQAVAGNPNTPPDVLRELAARSRYPTPYVSENAPPVMDGMTAAETMSMLAVLTVRGAVAGNPNTPSDVLRELGKWEPADDRIQSALAQNPNTPPETLAALARSDNKWLRLEVARNPNTPQGTVNAMKQDADPHICWLARQRESREMQRQQKTEPVWPSRTEPEMAR